MQTAEKQTTAEKLTAEVETEKHVSEGENTDEIKDKTRGSARSLRNRLCDKNGILYRACKMFDGAFSPVTLIAQAVNVIAKESRDRKLELLSYDWTLSHPSYTDAKVISADAWRLDFSNQIQLELDLKLICGLEDIYAQAMILVSTENQKDPNISIAATIDRLTENAHTEAEILVGDY
jgi:hypothetical protein